MAMKKTLVLLSLAVFVVSAPAQTQDWPQWRGPDGRGISLETGWTEQALANGAKVLWNVDLGYGYGNVVIKDGRLYAAGWKTTKEGSVFFCLDAATGATIWRNAYKTAGFTSLMVPHATPATDGERVYFLSLEGILYCLQASDGQLLWKRDLGADSLALKAVRQGTQIGWISSPVLYGNLVLINADTIGMAVDKTTGDLAWTTAMPKAQIPSRFGSQASPVVGSLNGATCAFFYGSSALIAVDLATAKTLWTYFYSPEEWHIVTDPLVFNNKTFLQMCTKCTLLDCSGAEPSVIWVRNVWESGLSNYLYTAVLVDGYLYGSDLPDGTAVNYFWDDWRKLQVPFRCLDWTTGNIKWTATFAGGASLIAADGKLIILDLDGTLRIAKASPAGYTELAAADVLKGAKKTRVFPTPPVLYGGRIYCRNYAGDLVCVDVSK
jgi:outer membrane protein assembly factor BamB